MPDQKYKEKYHPVDNPVEELGNIVIYDAKNPNSIYNNAPPQFQAGMTEIHPHWLGWTEKTLRKKVDPDVRDARFRTAFWIEYDRWQEEGNKFSMGNILKMSRTSWEYYRDHLCAESMKLCWVLTPPTSYNLALEEILDFGNDELREILQLPNMDKQGKVNTPLLKLKVDIIKNAEQRLHGSIVQKSLVDQRNINVSVSGDGKMELPASLDDIDKELKKISKNIKEAREVKAIEAKKVQ